MCVCVRERERERERFIVNKITQNLMYRECSFVSKTLRAEEVGAVAVIISDYKPSNDDLFIEMLDDETFRQTNIPAAFLVGKNG